ncbi:ATP-binding protein [Shewanella xiamenensis]|uniref:ATP-binding protein n=1 Tax=Shewanella xiamenensis TaxID=332186 RepID=UPI001184C222|nr:ATP-binding protein [Shewanella xiamenensis]TVL32913.1 AAA family ATPase [Shewanella xiamenensis]
MQLRYLAIPQFRNLRNLEVNFATELEPVSGSSASDTNATGSQKGKRIRSHALIGQNGTGKSNLIEALITLFRDVDLDREAAFDYTLEYEIRGHIVRIQADTAKQKRPYVWVDGKSESQGFLVKHAREYLPSHVFAYYSGKNERIETLFRTHQERYKQLLRQDDDDLMRRLFYCRGGHSQLVLLACLLSDDPVFKKLLSNLNIEAIESALFVLKKPYSARDLDEKDIELGDSRFWFRRGTVVNGFLDKLWQIAWAPVQETRLAAIDFRRRPEKQELLYLFVPDNKRLKKLGEEVGTPERFFRYAEAAYIGDLLEEVRITVKKTKGHGGDVEFKQLSEGELQMLTVLGLMRITREDHCLFLLDEPDTHLNPIWKLRYFDDIEGVLSSEKDSLVQGESQILITTHDPMMVGSLKREQVHILRKHGDRSVIESPDEHPQGMGVTGLLKSELFGLSSTLDLETERRLFRRNELFVKSPRTPDEDAELTRLSAELADLGFSTADFRDPDYALFVRKMAQHRKFRKPILTPEEQAEQDRIADEIINEILREEVGE